MRIYRLWSIVWLWILAASPAVGQQATKFTLIDDLLHKSGHAYEEARAEILEREDALELLRSSLGSRTYGRATWERLALNEALSMHITHSKEANLLRNLQGLKSDHYRHMRVPAPSVSRELRRLTHAAPLMIELFLKGMETYEWSSPATAGEEEAALRRDLLMAIGRSGHPASVHFLTTVIEGGCACCESCDTALRALGETGTEQAVPVLLRVLNKARVKGDIEMEATVITALGGIRRVEVWPYIEAELDNTNPIVREAAIRSAAIFGSRWHWRANMPESSKVRNAIGTALVEVLAEEKDEGIVLAVLESLSVVATPQLQDLLKGKQSAVSEEQSAVAKATVDSVSSSTMAGERFRKAAERVSRTLARQREH